MESVQDKILKIKEKVGRTSLYISRVPEEAKTRFMKLWNEKVESDYGMGLVGLMDFRDGILSSPNVELSQRIDILAEEIANLKNNVVVPEEQPKKRIRSVSGRTITEKEERK